MEKPIAFSFGPQKINNTIEKENTLNYDLKEVGKTITFSFESQKIDHTIKKGNELNYKSKEVIGGSSNTDLEKRVSLLEQTTVPKKLSLLPDVNPTSSRSSILLYADDNGKSCKISIKELLSKQIRTSSIVPDDLQEGEYLFLELKED